MSPEKTFPKSAWLLFGLLLGWVALWSIGVGLIQYSLLESWSVPLKEWLSIALATLGWLLPDLLFLGLTLRQNWREARPLAVALLLMSLYLSLEVILRAIVGLPPKNGEPTWLELGLHFIIITPLILGLGIVGLWSEIRPFPKSWELLRALGLGKPPLVGLLTAGAIVAGLTIGWPLSGALGDSYGATLILLQALSLTLPAELLFRGSIWELLGRKFPQPRLTAALLTLAMYWVSLSSEILPHGEWLKLWSLISALPLALLITELRATTGSIWAGWLVASCYQAAPVLFTDPRVELPLLTQPWQTLAYSWMFAGAILLFLTLWGGRQIFLSQAWPLPRWAGNGLALLALVITWGGWLTGWFIWGKPGFYDDGFLIIMAEQADLSGATTITDLTARRTFVRDQLLKTAEKTQPPIREALESAGLSYRAYYIINMLKVEGHHTSMAKFANLPGVARVVRHPNVRPYPQKFKLPYGDAPNDPAGIGENVRQVKADQVWQMGFTGQGIVVAGQDTGYDWQHPALKKAYRGYDNGVADHTYNWHDAWDGTAAAFDDDQHGTHTMGTILGDDGQDNHIGLAPGAQWIGCRNMRRGLGNPASYAECMEFFLAPYPTDSDFTKGDVTKSPQVINNSWGCPDVEGCDDAILEPATEALRAAGIMMVVSAGNDGPACETVVEPPARYDDVFSVGATGENGLITGFSSRGPVPGHDLLKPDIVAPGDNVRSSVPGGEYGTASGTSMAGPHVVGLVALLWSANPKLIGQIETTEKIIRQSAIPLDVKDVCPIALQTAGHTSWLDELNPNAVACSCGGVSSTPNNVYGWGQIDALAAVKLALSY